MLSWNVFILLPSISPWRLFFNDGLKLGARKLYEGRHGGRNLLAAWEYHIEIGTGAPKLR